MKFIVKDNISLKHIYNLPKIWLKVVTRALSHCLYINHLSQFACAIQIFGRWWICFKDILSLKLDISQIMCCNWNCTTRPGLRPCNSSLKKIFISLISIFKGVFFTKNNFISSKMNLSKSSDVLSFQVFMKFRYLIGKVLKNQSLSKIPD